MDERNQSAEKDEFWDLSVLLPPRPAHKSEKTPPTLQKDTEAVEITSPASSEKPYTVADSILTEHYVNPQAAPRVHAESPLHTYAPQHSLLHEVRVFAWRTQYDYYERFRHNALRFWQQEGVECPLTPFFSYMPQYTQLNAAQLATYFWWRSCFRKGIYLRVDYSYLLLALYEMINVGDSISPQEIQGQMVKLWLAYREEHPRLDSLVREWLCDYSLLYELPAPTLPAKLYQVLLSGCRLKEFYVPLSGKESHLVTGVLLFCNNYDYTKSKFFTPDTAEEYHRVLRGAVGVALEVLRERDGNALTGGSGLSTISRDTFVGAICSYRLRRRIEVDYTSFSHTHELRYIMSDVLKYAENALRAVRGIKTRLTIYAVDVAMRERLDAYLKTVLPERVQKSTKKQVEPPAYERRYDLPVSAPSPTRAAEIEARSWQTTKRLVEAFEQEAQIDTNIPPDGADISQEESPAPAHAQDVSSTAEALGVLCEFLQLVARGEGGSAQRRLADEIGMLLDAVADKINTVTGDILGDIVLEQGDDGYILVEDYREWLQEEGIL